MQFTNSQYTARIKVVAGSAGTSCHVYDSNGQVVLFSDVQVIPPKVKSFRSLPGSPVSISMKASSSRFKDFRENIHVYDGEDMREELLTIHAQQILDISGAHSVIDATTGKKIGALKRPSLTFKDEWTLLSTEDTEIGKIRESGGIVLLLLRQLLSDLVPQTWTVNIGDVPVATMKKQVSPFLTEVVIDFSPDTKGLLDKRLGIAAAILKCAISRFL